MLQVSNHKTNREFGPAQIYLDAEEYGWLETWLVLRSTRAPKNQLFFTTKREGSSKEPPQVHEGGVGRDGP